ncbi:MAG: neutral zinc metallopeptidase [Gemmatimonadota bacterium]|nr:neutral zinc metallopeptidase [Gemmatimonadota bacterium]
MVQWEKRGRSRNLEDRRGQRVGRAGVGIGGTLLLLVLSVFFGPEVLQVLGPVVSATNNRPQVTEGPLETTAAEEETVDYVSFLLDDMQAVWNTRLPRMGADYRETTLVLFRDATPSACGLGQSAMGPFYCPRDEKVYLDLSFFDELAQRFGAPGDFAQAYVLAHEIGHHVQNVLGISTEVSRLQQARPNQANQLSVRLELQADCLAGVWGASAAAQGRLEPGDAQEGLRAAAAIGDDRIQRQTQGRVVPESFTHGTSEQRLEWLRRGLQSGDPNTCDTFGA